MEKKLMLCEGRHEMSTEIEGSIFPNEVDVFNFTKMQQIVASKLEGIRSLKLYVTGLTVALVTVLDYCYNNGIDVTLFHYNRDTGEYVPQHLSSAKIPAWIDFDRMG